MLGAVPHRLVIGVVNLIATAFRHFHVGAKCVSGSHSKTRFSRHTKRTERRPGCAHAANTAKASATGLKDFPSTSADVFETCHAFGQATKHTLGSDLFLNLCLCRFLHSRLLSSLLSSLSGTFFSSGSGGFCTSRFSNFTCSGSGCSPSTRQRTAKPRTTIRAKASHQSLAKIARTGGFHAANE